MNAALIVVLVLVALIVLAVGVFVGMYNKFARQRNSVEESWRQIDVELQRRHDLIGNLVEVTRAAARFEQQTLAQVVEARNQAVAAHGAGPARQGEAEQRLNGALASFFAVAEQYPDLKASRDFLYLQQQLVETEDRIAAGRRTYNDNVRAFNTRFDTFPSSLVANFGKFEKKEYYEVDDPRARAAPSLRGAFDGLNEPVTPTPPLGQPMLQQPRPASGPPPRTQPRQAGQQPQTEPIQAQQPPQPDPRQAQQPTQAEPRRAERPPQADPRQAQQSSLAEPRQAERPAQAGSVQAQHSPQTRPRQAEQLPQTQPIQAQQPPRPEPRQAERPAQAGSVKAQRGQPYTGGNMPTDDSKAMPENPPQTPPAPPIPSSDPPGGAMPDQPPQTPPASPIRDPDDESETTGAMPDDPPQTPPAPPVQPPER